MSCQDPDAQQLAIALGEAMASTPASASSQAGALARFLLEWSLSTWDTHPDSPAVVESIAHPFLERGRSFHDGEPLPEALLIAAGYLLSACAPASREVPTGEIVPNDTIPANDTIPRMAAVG